MTEILINSRLTTEPRVQLASIVESFVRSALFAPKASPTISRSNGSRVQFSGMAAATAEAMLWVECWRPMRSFKSETNSRARHPQPSYLDG